MLTKHYADLEIARARQQENLSAVILYPGLMFGPGDLVNAGRLIQAIRAGCLPFNMPGGTNIVDVRDVARGITAVIKRGLNQGDYLLSGHNLTFKEINNTIARTVKAAPPRLTLPRFLNTPLFWLFLALEAISKKRPELPADNVDSSFKFRYFNNARAQKELGWRPEIDFKTTVIDTVNWLNQYE